MKKDVVKKSKNVVKQDKSINKRKRVHDAFFLSPIKGNHPKNTDKITKNYAIMVRYDILLGDI